MLGSKLPFQNNIHLLVLASRKHKHVILHILKSYADIGTPNSHLQNLLLVYVIILSTKVNPL